MKLEKRQLKSVSPVSAEKEIVLSIFVYRDATSKLHHQQSIGMKQES